ncbi:MAG TPA: Rne/Rng family ribonuclease [Methylocella sp.]|jgi:ribonuclease E
MANKMLIDSSHPEETRVVVLRGNRVEEFDFESASKKQLRGNIYLAKVMRVEPSLQAAFVDYGGNRHGFLAFSEIHPDYYQIPVADRQALIEDDARAQRDEEDDGARSQRRSRRFRRGDRNGHRAEKRSGIDQTMSEPYAGELAYETSDTLSPEAGEPSPNEPSAAEQDVAPLEGAAEDSGRVDADDGDTGALEAPAPGTLAAQADIEEFVPAGRAPEAEVAAAAESQSSISWEDSGPVPEPEQPILETDITSELVQDAPTDRISSPPAEPGSNLGDEEEDEAEPGEIEHLGGDAMEEMPVRSYRHRKQYKIQEVIKRRQVLLVQVVKEERGNKGAALTTYLSLAGRYSVLMPNTARGGGISRKITDSGDRQRLKSIAEELDVPEGMGVIVRTAGAARTKPEVKRDFEYLLRMWETVRETTLQSTAPMLVYEEGSLIKRAIRDLYNKDIDEVVVAGEEGYREAKEFMRLLMPSHAKMVQPYRDPQPMFAKSGAEAQLDAMFSNQVTLKSGGYIVINQTEALVAIDVNSGRSTREHNIEDTALRTNLEASDEIARQLRLRDLAGLIVIDFIDMEENRNNRTVERRLKDALKNDRARIQVGRMSHFGLLEMSRQRMRTGVIEGSTIACPHCAGAGMVRSTSSIALHVLRAMEDALIKTSSYDIVVKTRTAVALYILNQKRPHLRDLENRFGVSVMIAADDSLSGTNYYALERGELAVAANKIVPSQPVAAPAAELADRFFDDAAVDDDGSPEELATIEAAPAEGHTHRDSEHDTEGRQRRRRRRRRGRGGDREGSGIAANAPQPPDDALEVMAKIGGLQPSLTLEGDSNNEQADLSVIDETPFDRQDSERSSGRERRRPRRMTSDADGETIPSETQPESLELSGSEAEALDLASGTEANRGRSSSGRVRRSRRPPRGSRVSQIDDVAASAQEAEPDLLVDDVREQDAVPGASPPDIAAEVDSAFGNVQTEARETPSPDAYGSSEQPVTPPRLPEDSPRPETLDPARPKRSGWWQRARASGHR